MLPALMREGPLRSGLGASDAPSQVHNILHVQRDLLDLKVCFKNIHIKGKVDFWNAFMLERSLGGLRKLVWPRRMV